MLVLVTFVSPWSCLGRMWVHEGGHRRDCWWLVCPWARQLQPWMLLLERPQGHFARHHTAGREGKSAGTWDGEGLPGSAAGPGLGRSKPHSRHPVPAASLGDVPASRSHVAQDFRDASDLFPEGPLQPVQLWEEEEEEETFPLQSPEADCLQLLQAKPPWAAPAEDSPSKTHRLCCVGANTNTTEGLQAKSRHPSPEEPPARVPTMFPAALPASRRAVGTRWGGDSSSL